MPPELPSEQDACDIAREILGWPNAKAQRFTTGMAFFVYDVSCGGERAVIRIGRPEQAAALEQGRNLMERLRPLGVPLPEIFAAGERRGLPYMVMSRLAGTDLGHVIHTLAPEDLRQIAQGVADAQRATARSGMGVGFGYAATPTQAAHARWTDVIAAHIDRSRRRIVANGLFSAEFVDGVARLLVAHAPGLAAIEPTPFLHDTTTKNVIVSPEGRLSGIVDVDDLCYGDQRYPAALTAAAMLAWSGPQDYVTTWLSHLGQKRDALFEFYVATFLLDFMSEHGTRFNGNEAASKPEERQRLATLYQQALLDAEP